jgi:hypothetical protein
MPVSDDAHDYSSPLGLSSNLLKTHLYLAGQKLRGIRSRSLQTTFWLAKAPVLASFGGTVSMRS